MSCLIDTGYDLGCRDNIGGIKLAYIGNFSAEQTYTLGTASGSTADDLIVGVGGTLSTYYTFNQEVEVGEFNQEGQYSTENGTVFFVQTLTLMMHKNDADLRSKLLLLSQGHLSIIVQDQRGSHWLMGFNNGCRVVTGSQNTGRAFGDMNGITISFEGREAAPAYFMTPEAIADLTIN